MPMYPKLLPWLARRAGVTTDLAEKLWRRAVGDTVELAGTACGEDFHRFAIERFLDLLEGECPVQDAEQAASSAWYWRYQRRMAAHSFKAANLNYQWLDQFWKHFGGQRMLA